MLPRTALWHIAILLVKTLSHGKTFPFLTQFKTLFNRLHFCAHYNKLKKAIADELFQYV